MRDWPQRLRRQWFNLPLVRKGAIVISIPLACILFSVAATLVFRRQREQLTEWIARAFQAGSGIQAVVTLLSDAERGARGFLLTEDAVYLEPLRKAETNIAAGLARVGRYTGDLPAQRERLERLDVLTQERLTGLRTLLSAANRQAVAEEMAKGQALTAAIDREFAAMREEESRLWIGRIAAEQRLRERLSMVLYGSAVLSLAAGSLAMVLFLTGISRRAQALAENADRLARGEPLLTVSGGDDEIGHVSAALAKSSDLLAERDRDLRRLNEELEARVRERTAALEREVAERRKSEEQLRESQKMEAMGRLAGGIAHDFNNVLTVVIGFGESLAEKVGSDAEAREDLEEVLQAAYHATTLTRQLLAFSRRQVLQPRPILLNEVVVRTEKLLRRVLGEDIELQTICPEMRERVLMDEGQLEQVLMNLVVNARDAMPQGGRLVIQTDLVEFDEPYCGSHLDTRPGWHVLLAVRDSGVGMKPEVQARIFEPFFTTKAPGKGTGLGLSTVYGIVKQSGGSIWVYSEPGKGTLFKIYFPVVADAEARPPGAPAAMPEASPATILLVEDEPGVRRIASQILARRGHTVLVAEGPEEALELCRRHGADIDLLLTDVVMPKMNGWELAKTIEASHPTIKVLYMSGYTDDAARMRSVLEPGVAFIEKPFTPASLTRRIGEVMASGGRQ